MQVDNHSIQYEKLAETNCLPTTSQCVEECPSLSMIALQIFAVEYTLLQQAWGDQRKQAEEQTKIREAASLEDTAITARVWILGCLFPLSEGGGIAMTTTASTVQALKTTVWINTAMTVVGSLAIVGGVICCGACCWAQCEQCDAHERDRKAKCQVQTSLNQLGVYREGFMLLNAAADFYVRWEKFITSPTDKEIDGLLHSYDEFKAACLPYSETLPDLLLMHHICLHLDVGSPVAKQWKALVEDSTSSKFVWGQTNIKFWASLGRAHPQRDAYKKLFEHTNLDQYAELHKVVERLAKEAIASILKCKFF